MRFIYEITAIGSNQIMIMDKHTSKLTIFAFLDLNLCKFNNDVIY